MPKGFPGSAEHGGTGSLYNSGCRCELCVLAHRRRMREGRVRRRSERVMVKGALVAVKAATHGTVSTYRNWGCQCPPCHKAGQISNRQTHRKYRS
jgi:hypothetical protein